MRHFYLVPYEILREESVLGEYNRPTKRLVSKGIFRGKLDNKNGNTHLIVGEPQTSINGNYRLYTNNTIDIRPSDFIKIQGMVFRASLPQKYPTHMEVNLTLQDEV